MPKINPAIPAESVQYFSNARGVYYLPSLESEWKKSGYLPRMDQDAGLVLWNLAPAGNRPGSSPTLDGLGFGDSSPNIFIGANPASIWRYYDEDDHRKGLSELKKLGINCIRTPLNYDIYQRDPTSYLNNVKSFLKVCDEYKVRVQFILWDAEQNLEVLISDVAYSLFGSLGIYPPSEPTDYFSNGSNAIALSVDHPRNPYLSIAASAGFFTDFAGDYLDAVASSVSSYQSMWCFDLCNKPVSGFYDLVVSSQSRLNQNLSSTNIKYTFSPKDGLNIFNDTSYLDNGKGTGPSGAFGIEDIKNFSSIIDFVSVPFIANNDYAFKRYLNGAISGTTTQGISKPFMVYAAYDPELGQNLNATLNVLDTSSVGYFNDLGLVDNVFRFGRSKEKSGNIYSDGQYKDLGNASALLTEASSINWYNRRDLTKVLRLKQKEDGSDGFLSGVPSTLTSLDRDISPSAVEHWSYLKDYYVNTPGQLESVIKRVPGGSTTFKPRFDSKYNDSTRYSILVSSLFNNTLEENLDILYNFDTYFPKISSYPFSLDGATWEAINATMIYRNEFLQLLAKYVIDHSEMPYAELRNSVYDTNPIPDYERGELTELFEVMTDTTQLNRNPTTNIKNTVTPPTLSGTATYAVAAAVYGVSDSGTDFATYYDTYYSDVVTQLKKCLMWLYWKGDSDPAFKIVSDSFLAGIGFESSSLSSVEIYPGVSVAPSLSAVQSPLYTVKIFNPSTSTFDDSFVFVVSGQSRQVTSYVANSEIFSGYWAVSGSRPPISFTTVGLSAMSVARVTLPSPAGGETSTPESVSSVEMYPKRYAKYRQPALVTIGEGAETYIVADIPMVIGDKIYLEINGNVSAPLCIFADPFKPAIPSGMSVYNGQTRASYVNSTLETPNMTSSTGSYYSIAWDHALTGVLFSSLPGDMYFPAGVHNISGAFPISPSSTYYLDANAYLIGTFDVVSGYDSKFIGRGVISSEQYPRSFIKEVKDTINSNAAMLYSNIGMSVSGSFGSILGNDHPTQGVDLDGIILTNAGFYTNDRQAVENINNCKSIVPWTYNADGFKVKPQNYDNMAKIKNSIVLAGDDTLNPFTSNWRGPTYIRNVFSIPYRGSVIATYYGGGIKYKTVVKDLDVLYYGPSGTAPTAPEFYSVTRFEGNALINIYTDYPATNNWMTGLANVEIDNWDIHGGGGSAVYIPMFHVASQPYVYTTAARYDGAGSLSGFTISNINISPSAYPPEHLGSSSTIYGLSAGPLPAQLLLNNASGMYNAPANIAFSNFKIGLDTFLTDANRDDWIAWVNPASSLVSVTDPDVIASNITFKTT
tara:strand:- start:1030 stop:4974 length:3945 start_codon:yes stop_codon:yes gene_type:complete